MNDKVSVQVVTFGAMNFAMQQNYVPLVRSVTIKNNSDEEIKDIMLKFPLNLNLQSRLHIELRFYLRIPKLR